MLGIEYCSTANSGFVRQGFAYPHLQEPDMAADYQVKFNVHPPYRVKERKGEVWIEGEGLALAVGSIEDGQTLIQKLMEDPEEAITEYLSTVSWPADRD